MLRGNDISTGVRSASRKSARHISRERAFLESAQERRKRMPLCIQKFPISAHPREKREREKTIRELAALARA